MIPLKTPPSPSKKCPIYESWYLPSPKFIWRLIEGPIQRIVVLKGAPLNFHVNLEECSIILNGVLCH